MKKLLKLSTLIVLCWLFFGSLFYPYWYYLLLFEGHYHDWSFWWQAISYDVTNFGPLAFFTALTIWAVLSFSRTSLPDRLLSASKSVRDEFLLGKKVWMPLIVLVLGSATTLSFVEIRSRSDRETQRKFEETIARSEALMREWEIPHEKPVLSEPTTFLFLQKDAIDSLYGQYEPDLIPAIVVDEIQNSTEFKGKASIGEYLSTDVGKRQYERQLTQYRQTIKTPERQLRDLLKYLSEKKLVKRFSTLELTSPDLKQLDSATQLLAHKYDVVVDKQKLRALRDKLLIAQRTDLEDQLKSLHGLVLIEGDWFVDNRQDAYILRRPFLEEVSNPPLCEVKVPKSGVAQRDREIIESLARGPLRLTIFGNVLVGMTGRSQTVLLVPVAVFQ